MRTHAHLNSLLLTALLAAPLPAQDVRILRMPDADRRVIIRDDSHLEDRPLIGITTAAESERGDTLGLRIESVQRGSPAEQAGLKEGDRLQAVNGVSLRADRADAGEEDYAGVLTRRLQREVQRTAAGELVDLRVLSSGGQSRSVKVTPVKASSLASAEPREFTWTVEGRDRAVLGLTVGGSASARDTLGVFVQSVVRDGPAEKAGIVEGDRIAAINGVSLRVAREDAEDGAVAAARAERLSREVAKLEAGDTAELTVVSGGRARTVRVTTSKASSLPEGMPEGLLMRAPVERMLREMPLTRTMPEPEARPRVTLRRSVRVVT